jgi:hypothetical protein
MMGTRQHRDLCTNAGCAGLVPECCRRLGKELFGHHAVRLSGPFILVFGDALSYQEALEYFEVPLQISSQKTPIAGCGVSSIFQAMVRTTVVRP